MNMNIFATVRPPLQLIKAAVSAALVLTLAACGGGGTTPVTGLVTPGSTPATTVLLLSIPDDASSVPIFLEGIGDAVISIAPDPVTSLEKVVKVVDSTNATSADVAITLDAGQSIPFTASAQTLTLRVWSAAAGIPVRLRVENASDPANPVDAQAVTTTANGWQTLTFDFSAPIGSVTTASAVLVAPDTQTNAPVSRMLASISPALLDLTETYNKVSVFFNYGKESSSNDTYYFSNLQLSVPGSSALRPLSPEFLARKAVNYSPYRDSEKNEDRPYEDVTDAEVLQDLTLLKEAGFGLIRLFDSDEKVAQRVLRVITANNLDIKVYLGMWMAGNNDAGNKDQMARGVALANSYPSIVVAVSVGNESLVSWSGHKIPVNELAANIKTVREQIKQPVTTDDNWAYYAAADRAILDVIDFAAVHTYAMVDTHYLPDPWDWQQLGVTDLTKRAAAMMDAAMVATKADYQAARSSLDKKGLGAMPIVIGETGWMAVNPSNKWYTFLAHPVNQKMYLDRLTAWAAEGKAGAGPKNVFYFEAFDEPWKGDDNGWGLFNVKREARYAIQSLKGNGSALTACTFSTAQLTFIDQANNCKWIWEAGTYTDADALYYKPVVVGAPVTADRYRVYADIAVIGEALPTESPFWVGWGGSAGDTAFTGELTSDITSGDIPTTREIQPAPEVWGWGMIAALQSTAEDLTGFEATGRLNFSIKTSYPGKVEVGFLTGTTTTGSAYDVYLPIDPTNNPYGYKNDGAWHQVSIPISAIKPFGAMAFGMTDPSKAKLDLTKVTNPFVIADRYGETGKTAGFAGNTDKIYVDAVYWSK